MKSKRQAAILEIVDREAITSQEQLRDRLRERGIDATQATLSRDVRDLALIKRAADGAYRRAGAEPVLPVTSYREYSGRSDDECSTMLIVARKRRVCWRSNVLRRRINMCCGCSPLSTARAGLRVACDSLTAVLIGGNAILSASGDGSM